MSEIEIRHEEERAKRLSGKNVFVTGVTGSLGSPISRQVVAEGASVAGLTRSIYSAEKLLSAGIDPVVGENTNRDVLRAGLKDADIVLNLAANFSGKKIDMRSYFDNVWSMMLLVECALESSYESGKPIRIVQAGTVGQYPVQESDRTESKATGAAYAYSETKAYASTVLMNAGAVYPDQIKPCELLISHAWGPDVRGALSGTGAMIDKAGKWRGKPIVGSGDNSFAFVDQDNIVEAFIRASYMDPAVGARINLVGGETTWNEVVADIEEAKGSIWRIPTPLARRAADVMEYHGNSAPIAPEAIRELLHGPGDVVYDTTNAQEILGMSFTTPEEGIRKTTEELRRRGVL